MKALLALLPPWVMPAAIGVLLLALAGGTWALVAALEAKGAATVIAADQKAVIEQHEKDARLSAAIVANQAQQLAELSTRAQTVITRIDHAPQTTGCGPVMRDASRGLHELFERPGRPQTGREPAAAVPGPRPRRGP